MRLSEERSTSQRTVKYVLIEQKLWDVHRSDFSNVHIFSKSWEIHGNSWNWIQRILDVFNFWYSPGTVLPRAVPRTKETSLTELNPASEHNHNKLWKLPTANQRCIYWFANVALATFAAVGRLWPRPMTHDPWIQESDPIYDPWIYRFRFRSLKLDVFTFEKI